MGNCIQAHLGRGDYRGHVKVWPTFLSSSTHEDIEHADYHKLASQTQLSALNILSKFNVTNFKQLLRSFKSDKV